MEWDPGPPTAIQTIFEQAPLSEYRNNPKRFRLEWGPIFYRGQLDCSAKILIIGQDPAADENVARRILVGDAGQRVQGFLTKLGITRSYVMVNSVLYSIYGQFDDEMGSFIDIPIVAQWRNQLLDALVSPSLKTILAFGIAAGHVADTWPGSDPFKNQGRVFYLTHPTARPESKVLQNWNSMLSQISAIIPADQGGTTNLSPYKGPQFRKSDLSRIPLWDFSFGVPLWMGTGNMATRSYSKPKGTKKKSTIIWIALDNEG